MIIPSALELLRVQTRYYDFIVYCQGELVFVVVQEVVS